MTEMRILQLAYDGALDLWSFAKEKADRFPENEILAKNEARAWDELTVLHDMLYEAEQKKIREEELKK